MTDVVEHDLKPWEPASGRRTALGAAGLLMALGAVALLIQRGSLLAGDRRGRRRRGPGRRRDRALPRPARARGRGRGGLDGRGLRRGRRPDARPRRRAPFFGYPVAAAGGRRMAAGLVCLVGLGEGRTLVIPPIVVGAVFLAIGLLLHRADFDAAVVLTVALVAGRDGRAASSRGWRSASPARRRPALLAGRHHRRPRRDRPAPGRRRRPGRARDPGRRLRDGRPAARADRAARRPPRPVRHHPRRRLLPGRDAPHPAVPHRLRGARRPGLRHPRAGLGRGLAAGLSTRTGGRPPPSCSPRPARCCSRSPCCPSTPSVRRGRLGDVAETVALLALLPLLVLATGVFGASSALTS